MITNPDRSNASQTLHDLALRARSGQAQADNRAAPPDIVLTTVDEPEPRRSKALEDEVSTMPLPSVPSSSDHHKTAPSSPPLKTRTETLRQAGPSSQVTAETETNNSTDLPGLPIERFSLPPITLLEVRPRSGDSTHANFHYGDPSTSPIVAAPSRRPDFWRLQQALVWRSNSLDIKKLAPRDEYLSPSRPTSLPVPLSPPSSHVSSTSAGMTELVAFLESATADRLPTTRQSPVGSCVQ